MSTAVAFQSVICLAGLFGFAFYVWPRLVTDLTRQRIFELRDEVFDLAVNGDLSFEDMRYQAVRDQFNSMIRFTHELSLSNLLAVAMVERPERENPFAALEGLPDHVKRKVFRNLVKATDLAVGGAILRSTVFAPIFVLLFPAMVLVRLLNLHVATEKLFIRPIGRMLRRLFGDYSHNIERHARMGY